MHNFQSLFNFSNSGSSYANSSNKYVYIQAQDQL